MGDYDSHDSLVKSFGLFDTEHMETGVEHYESDMPLLKRSRSHGLSVKTEERL